MLDKLRWLEKTNNTSEAVEDEVKVVMAKIR